MFLKLYLSLDLGDERLLSISGVTGFSGEVCNVFVFSFLVVSEIFFFFDLVDEMGERDIFLGEGFLATELFLFKDVDFFGVIAMPLPYITSVSGLK